MKYRLSTGYRWVLTSNESFIVKMYFIEYVPYTFDEIPQIAQDDPQIVTEANRNTKYTDEQLYLSSIYLNLEEAHPLMFELEYLNPENLPVD